MVVMSPVNDNEYTLTDEQATAIESLMKRKRLEAGYARQTDAAKAVGLSQDFISRMESRFTPSIRVAEFGRILRLYGITPNEAYEILGLYDPEVRPTERRTYVERELIPVLANLTKEQLEIVKRVAEGLR